ncbi:MAG: 30S ribosomal protein S27e [Euryarchaeota archaeon]|nr:30S ribosomal protein S27e [Euryarchaeota archaeon]MDE1835941.1 30S ribosomal protein S27e [Euryarchaeota archaeon]MDE1880613.1 30S ribosomal protein S27e [Euryarchaeota archaeon]MDE2044381.1 30S ribosomal protein S27e [Thermoplasmata archaeon]
MAPEEEGLPPENAPRPRAPFVVVKCKDCSKEHVVFSRPATSVNCSICGAPLARPTGGRGNFLGEVVRTVA